MPEQNPYTASQIFDHVVKTTVAPVNRRKRQPPWEEPLCTKLRTIARLQRTMILCTALLTLATVALGAWVATRLRDFPSSVGDWVVLVLLSPVAGWLVVTVYRLVSLLEDGDSPLFLALAVLVPGFNLMLIFYVDNMAIQYLRESEIASGWLGINDQQFMLQVELLRDKQQASLPLASLPVAEEVVPDRS
jgi:hypothetical protein